MATGVVPNRPADNRISAALGPAPLRQPARHHRRRPGDVARFRRRRARACSPTSISTSPLPQTTPLFGIIALALTFVVITGEIDLSLPVDHGARHGGLLPGSLPMAACPGSLALACALATGAACGWINGALVARLNIPSLVITIGTRSSIRGLELVLMNGTGVPLTADKFPQLHALLRAAVFGFPVQTLWMVGILAVCLAAAQPHPVRRARLPGRRQSDERPADGRQRRFGEDARLRAGRRDGRLLPA